MTPYFGDNMWYRVVPRGRNPLRPAPYDFAGSGRWDVGGRDRKPPSDAPSDVVCFGADEVIALAERLDRFRPWNLPAELKADEDSLPEWVISGHVPVDFCNVHRIAGTIIESKYRFAEIAMPEFIRYLNEQAHLVAKARKFGYTAIDLGVLTGPHFAITQAISLFLYRQTDKAGKPLFDGIIYPSRLGVGLCLAVYASRVPLELELLEPIRKSSPALWQALHYTNLTMEGIPVLPVIDLVSARERI